MKTSLLLIFLTLIAINIYAQDTLVYVNGQRQIVKVEEVNSEQIKYHKADNLNGPLYSVSSEEIKFVKYLNGTQDVFVGDNKIVNELKVDEVKKPNNPEQKKEIIEKPTDTLMLKTPNLIYINLLSLATLTPSINFESLFGKGDHSFWVPVSFGLNAYGKNLGEFAFGPMGITGVRKLFSIGIGYKKYYNRKRGSKFFIAPLFESGSVVYNKFTWNGYYDIQKKQTPFYMGSLNFGNMYLLKNGLILMVQGGVGLRAQKTRAVGIHGSDGLTGIYTVSYYDHNTSYHYVVYPALRLGFSIGYKF